MKNNKLFNKLKEWRLNKSKELKIPAFCILNNKTLTTISETEINNKSELIQIKGVGSTVVKKYGSDIINIICKGTKNEKVIEKKSSKQKEKNVVRDVTQKKMQKFSLSKEDERRIKTHLKGRASEMAIKTTLVNLGYTVLRGEKWLSYHLKNKPENFRDKKQMERVSRCVSICKNNKVGLPDFFVYSDNAEFFLEVKSNDANLNDNQKEVFPAINKIIKIMICRINMNFRMVSLGMTIEDYKIKK